MQAFSKAAKFLATVVVQDALELAERYPLDPAHAKLLQDCTFR